MATTIQGYISDVTLPNSDQYPIRAAAIPYGEVDSTSTSTAYTATIPGIYSLVDGVTVMLKNGVVTSASGFTININNLGAKPVYSNMTTGYGTTAPTRDTTIFNINYTMLLIYSTDIVSGGGWICYRGYDANTTYTLTQDSTDGHKITLTPSSGTATTITIPDNNTTDLGNMTGTLEITHGGTGGTTAAAARTNLGLGSAATYTATASVGNNSNLPTGAAIQSYVTGLGYITSASVPSAATATPLMDGIAAVGTSGKWAKEDHIHPSDTAKVDVNSIKSGTVDIYGKITNNGNVSIQTTNNRNDDYGEVQVTSGIVNLIGGTFGSNAETIQGNVQARSTYSRIGAENNETGIYNYIYVYPNKTIINNVQTPTADGDAANKKYVDDGLSSKQATLVSGTNIKTINGTSLLGSGDITIGGTPSAIDSSTIHTKAVAGWNGINYSIIKTGAKATSVYIKFDTAISSDEITEAQEGATVYINTSPGTIIGTLTAVRDDTGASLTLTRVTSTEYTSYSFIMPASSVTVNCPSAGND